MRNMKDSPAPLRRKLYMTVLLGLFCLLIGIAVYFFSKDKTMLFLSGTVCVLSILRAYSVFRIVVTKQYEVVEGTCVGIIPKPMRKYRKIRIMDDEGNECALLLSKQTKVKIGYRYRFYFKQTQQISLGSEYLDTSVSSDHFLGYEELGDFENHVSS